jgi:hypothetical protein
MVQFCFSWGRICSTNTVYINKGEREVLTIKLTTPAICLSTIDDDFCICPLEFRIVSTSQLYQFIGQCRSRPTIIEEIHVV